LLCFVLWVSIRSSDGGRTIHNNNPQLEARLQLVSRILNLRPHYVWNWERSAKTLIYTAVDWYGAERRREMNVELRTHSPPLSHSLLPPSFATVKLMLAQTDGFTSLTQRACSLQPRPHQGKALLSLHSPPTLLQQQRKQAEGIVLVSVTAPRVRAQLSHPTRFRHVLQL
jgi:hypothetical protein